MRAFARTLAAVAALAFLGGASAGAQDSAPGRIEEKLKGFEPATVAAAESFARSFNLGGMVQKSVPFLVQTVTNQLRTKNPELTEEQAQEFVSAFLQNLLEDNGKILERAAVLDMVEIMSRDELEALIRFQSTPVGASALKKMPTLSARMTQIMPLMQTYVVPRAMESAQAQMRKNGVEVKI
jgi:hypothetical protein